MAADLQHMTIDGQPATVAFMDAFDGSLVDAKDAKVAVATFADGGIAHYVLAAPKALGGVGSGVRGHTTEHDTELLQAYTRTGGAYREVNTNLREGKDMTNDPTVMALDHKFATESEPAPSVVYRGLAGYEPDELHLEVSSTFTDKGFVSTSSAKTDATKFALAGEQKIGGQAVGIIFKINTGHVPSLNMNRYSRYSENETLLQRGTTFKVTSVKDGYPGEKLAVVNMSVVK